MNRDQQGQGDALEPSDGSSSSSSSSNSRKAALPRGYNAPNETLSLGYSMNPICRSNAPGTGTGFRAQLIKAENLLRQEEEGPVTRKRKRAKAGGLFEILACFIGQRLRVELKNNDEVTGVVSSTTNCMDLFLEDVQEVSGVDGKVTHLDSMIVRGNTVCYVHLPADVNVLTQLTAIARAQEYKRDMRSLNVLTGREGRDEGITKELKMY